MKSPIFQKNSPQSGHVYAPDMRILFNLGMIGLIQGLLWYCFKETPFLNKPFSVGLDAFVLLSGLFIQLSWQYKQSLIRLITSSMIIAAIFAGIYGWRYGNESQLYQFYRGGFAFLIYATYIVNTFHQVYQTTGRLTFPYPELFKNAWHTVFSLCIACLFFLLGKFLILLWRFLFSIIGINFFNIIFSTDLFIYLIDPILFGVGLGIAVQYEKIINTLRSILLGLFAILLPILSAIVLLFAIALIMRAMALHSLSALVQASHSWVYLFICLMMIFSVNAIYQDGEKPSFYPNWLKVMVMIFIIISPLFAVLSLLIIKKEIQAVGINLMLFQQSVFVSLLSLYVLCYSLGCFFKPKNWLAPIEKINVVLAWIVVFCSLLINIFAVEFIHIIVTAQIERLKQGKRVDAYSHLYQADFHQRVGLTQAQLDQTCIKQVGSYKISVDLPQG